MELTEIQEEFLQWQKDNGKARYGLTDIYVNDNGKIKKEKKMAWTIKTSLEDWKDFCKATGKDYEEIKLLSIY